MKKLLIHGRNTKPSSGGGGGNVGTIEYLSFHDPLYSGGISDMQAIDASRWVLFSETMDGSIGDPFILTVAGDITRSDLLGCYVLTDTDGFDTPTWLNGRNVSNDFADPLTFQSTNVTELTGVEDFVTYNKNVFLIEFGSFISSEIEAVPYWAFELYTATGDKLAFMGVNISIERPRAYFDKLSVAGNTSVTIDGAPAQATIALPGEYVSCSIYGYWSEEMSSPKAKVISTTNTAFNVGDYITFGYSRSETDYEVYSADIPIANAPCTFVLEFNNDSYCRVTFNVSLR